MSKEIYEKIQEALEVHSIDELSTELLARYKKKAGEQASDADKKGDFKKGNKRFSGIMKATRKQFDNDAKNESVEEIDELSVKTMDSYYKKASKEGDKHSETAYTHWMLGNKKAGDKSFNKAAKRSNGVNQAINKIRAKQAAGVSESAESIDEVSKTTLGSYVKAATKDKTKLEKLSAKKDDEQNRLYDRAGLAQEKRRAKGQKGVQSDQEVKLRGKASRAYTEKLMADIKAKRRAKGIEKATGRLTKEEVEALDEISKKTLASYHAKASVDSYDHSRKALDAFADGDKEKDDYHFKKMNKRELGKIKAVTKGKLDTNEEVETIEELSRKTLATYTAMAASDARNKSVSSINTKAEAKYYRDNAKNGISPHMTRVADNLDHRAKVLDKKSDKRMSGVFKAAAKLAKEDINESCKVGDPVTVQTASGAKTGRVNDITKTHIGVKHADVKGIVHYHPEYVKKVVKEELDDTLMEGVSWERWDRSHKGVKGMSKSNSGGWMVSKHSSGYRYGHKEGEDHITVNGTGKEAAKKASEWAKEKGHGTVYMLETFTAEPVKQLVTLSSIANSALTTAKK